MNQDSVIADIEERAQDAGVSIRALCLRAKVHPTTFSRWKRSERNPDPMGASLLAIGRIYAVLAAVEAEKANRRRARRAA